MIYRENCAWRYQADFFTVSKCVRWWYYMMYAIFYICISLWYPLKENYLTFYSSSNPAHTSKSFRFTSLRFNVNSYQKFQCAITIAKTVLENIKNIKYLGVTITHRIRGKHVSNICTKAENSLTCKTNFIGLTQGCEENGLPGTSASRFTVCTLSLEHFKYRSPGWTGKSIKPCIKICFRKHLVWNCEYALHWRTSLMGIS